MNLEIKRAGLQDRKKVYFAMKQPRTSLRRSHFQGIGVCGICGEDEERIQRDVINEELRETWSLSVSEKKMFDARESAVCQNCKTSLRSSMHAKAISQVLSCRDNLWEAMQCDDFRQLKIAEINACGSVHQHISTHPGLEYSEYKPSEKGIRHEDITKLTYEDNEFDAVITSDTLEHVPSWIEGLEEIRRVLKEGGYHIFTVPAILTRKTRTRAILENGKIKNLLPKSFHGCTRGVDTDDYIVCSEFGADFIKKMDSVGFKTHVYYMNILRPSDPNIVFVSQKVGK